jgi:hypothetical protein
MVTEVKQPAQQSQEEEPPQAPQPEAMHAEQPAGAGPLLGSALQEHIAQAIRPIFGEWEQRIVQTVRQQMEQARHKGLPQEGAEAALSSLQAVVQGTAASSQQAVQFLSNTLSALLQTVRSMIQAVVSALRAVVLALQEAVTAALRLVMQALASVVQQLGATLRQVVEVLRLALVSVVQQLGEILRQVVELLPQALASVVQLLGEILRLVMRVLASVVQQLRELLRQALASVAQLLREILQPTLLEALPHLVQPLLQSAAERGVAAVLKTLESTLQERPHAQPASAGAQEVAAR